MCMWSGYVSHYFLMVLRCPRIMFLVIDFWLGLDNNRQRGWFRNDEAVLLST